MTMEMKKPHEYNRKATPPVLNLSDGADMLFDFIAETLRYLANAENAVFKLETVPDDPDSIDGIFRVFHGIRGLAEFLGLADITFLSHEAEMVIDMLRKNNIPYTETVAHAVIQAIDSLRQLLTLLNEQIHSNGALESPYHDIGVSVALLRSVAGQGGSASPPASVEATVHEFVENEYRALEQKVRASDGPITIESDTLRKLLNDLHDAQLQTAAVRKKLLARQRNLMQEREFALKLSDEARSVARAKGDFLSAMAHEIRTLINAILGFSELLMKSHLEETQRDKLKTIISSGRLLLDIVNNILDYSKIERGKLKLESIEFDLRRVVDDVLRLICSRLNDKAIKLRFYIAQDVPRNLVGDPTKLKQVLLNFFDNAVKFTEKGEIKLSIYREHRLEKTGEASDKICLRFSIADTGIGIPDDRRQAIFESFTQADTSITRRYGGSGLGLSICKSYIEAMGGAVHVESTLNKGSEFTFTAWFVCPQGPPAGSDAGSSTRGVVTVEKEPEAPDSCAGVRVLVAEDSIPNQELLKAYFELLGCSGEYVATGAEAIEKLKVNPYDLCLMDLQMPDMGGIEATENVKNTLKLDMPVIALTGAAADEERERCLQAGMVDYLSKPFDLNSLKHMILRYARRRGTQGGK